jgi:Oxidoreductase family, NAD-binding Rossmann fold
MAFLSRRYFMFGTLLTGALPRPTIASLKALGYQSPNEKLNIAGIGAGGQPFGDLRQCEAENIVALADVDWKRGEQGFKRWEKAARYKDFRQMLDKEHKNIDAVVVGTPDHTHTHAALACMQMGKGVYVEKPLTRTPWEARLLTQAAERYKVATQMGNQGYSHDATRVACEIFWAGEIGEVREVHAWTGRASWPQEMTKIPASTPVPDTLDWDLWLGGAAARPFTAGDQEYKDHIAARNARTPRGPGGGGGGGGMPPGAPPGGGPPGGFPGADSFGFYAPFNWRGFYDFGSGLIGDWGVHILGPANWALQLHPKHLISVECIKKSTLPPFSFPDELTIKYEFGARGSMPPVTVYWYHAPKGDPYLPPGMSVGEARKIAGQGPQVGPAGGGFGPGARPPGAPAAGPPQGAPAGMPRGMGYNSIFVGAKGFLGTSGRGEGVGLLPGSRWAEYKLPAEYLPRSPGASTGSNHAAHCRDWIRACKGGAPACSNFSLAGPYTEWLVLGAIAVRVESRLLWDNTKGEITNNRAANQLVRPLFRKGWEVRL